MGYQVVTVANRSHLKDFLKLPFSIYRGDPNWIPPMVREVRRTLNARQNPYFRRAALWQFVCYQQKQPVARTVVVVNRDHLKKFQRREAFFGFFEAFDDPLAVQKLFEAVESLLRSQGIERLTGPFNPNHYSEIGLQTDHFGELPTFFQSYNPAYYLKLLTACGFQPYKEIYTCLNKQLPEFLQNPPVSVIQESYVEGFSVRSFNMKCFKDELENIRQVFNDAFSDNWYFLPLSREEYLFSSRYLKLVTFPELISLIEYDHQPVGVLQCVLDINPLLRPLGGRASLIKYLRFLRSRHQVRKLVVFAVGVKKAFWHSPVIHLIEKEFCRMAAGFQCAETTWTTADNLQANRVARRMGFVPDRHFVIVSKNITRGE